MEDKIKLLLVSDKESFENTIVSLLDKEAEISFINYNFDTLQEEINKRIDLLIIDTREKEGIDFYFTVKNNEETTDFPVLCITQKFLTKEMAVQLTVSLTDVNVSFPIDKIKFHSAYIKTSENTKRWYNLNEIKRGLEVKENQLLYKIYELKDLQITGNLIFETEDKKCMIHLSNGKIDKVLIDNTEIKKEKAAKELSELKKGILRIGKQEIKESRKEIKETNKITEIEKETPVNEKSKESSEEHYIHKTKNIEDILQEIVKEKGVEGISLITKEGKEKYSLPPTYSPPWQIKKMAPFFISFTEHLGQKLREYRWKGTSLVIENKQFMLVPEKENVVIIESNTDEPLEYYIKELE